MVLEDQSEGKNKALKSFQKSFELDLHKNVMEFAKYKQQSVEKKVYEFVLSTGHRDSLIPSIFFVQSIAFVVYSASK